jgi:hypothetical protein
MDSLVLQTVIGIVFVFAMFASLVSVLTELVTRFLGLRGEYLLRGLRTLLAGSGDFSLGLGEMITIPRCLRKDDDPERKKPKEEDPATTVMEEVLRALGGFADKGVMPKGAGIAKLTNKERRSLPSYLSGRSVAEAILAVVVPDTQGTTTIDMIRNGLRDDTRIPAALRDQLDRLAAQAEGSVAVFRRGVERWYDDQMDRVSGWYKRHVRWISLGIGIALVLAFNLNVFGIARSIYTDEALRGSVVAQATSAAQCGTKDPATCLGELRTEIAGSRGAGLPIGWSPVPDCRGAAAACSTTETYGLTAPHGDLPANVGVLVPLLIGWILMVLALLPGARFWFDALSRLGSLRASGPKPDRET